MTNRAVWIPTGQISFAGGDREVDVANEDFAQGHVGSINPVTHQSIAVSSSASGIEPLGGSRGVIA